MQKSSLLHWLKFYHALADAEEYAGIYFRQTLESPFCLMNSHIHAAYLSWIIYIHSFI